MGSKIPDSKIVAPGTDFLYLRKPGSFYGPTGGVIAVTEPIGEEEGLPYAFARAYLRFVSICPACKKASYLREPESCPYCRFPQPSSADRSYFKMFGRLPHKLAVQMKQLREWAGQRQVVNEIDRTVAYAGKAREFMRRSKWARKHILGEWGVTFD